MLAIVVFLGLLLFLLGSGPAKAAGVMLAIMFTLGGLLSWAARRWT